MKPEKSDPENNHENQEMYENTSDTEYERQKNKGKSDDNNGSWSSSEDECDQNMNENEAGNNSEDNLYDNDADNNSEENLYANDSNNNSEKNLNGNNIVTGNHSEDNVLPQKIPPRKIKKGLEIEMKSEDSDQWLKAKVISRAGKATGKYRYRWNVLENGSINEIDLEKTDWRETDQSDVENLGGELHDEDHDTDVEDSDNDEDHDTDTEEVNLCETYLSHVDQQTMTAKQAEHENWIREDVYEEVDDIGQDTMSVKWVITPKIINGVMATKARLVARGFEEDKSELRTDSPTCMRETLKIVLAFASSKKWEINSMDIKAAFLQGKPIERELFLRPPKEFRNTGKIWKLKKVVYGLSDASRVWYMRVVDELLRINCTISEFDKALFLWKSNGKTAGILLVHVDDFLWCGSDAFGTEVISKLKATFRISKESEKAFKYLGIELKTCENYLDVNQKSYTDSIKPIEIERPQSASVHDPVDSIYRKKFRGLVGQLSWAAGISRPDAAFNACSLSTAQANPTYSDIKEANKAVRDIQSACVHIKYPYLDLDSASIVVHSDASYGNLKDGCSQGGHIIFLADQYGNCSPVSWGSKKIKRVVRSTLGAETLSAVDALDSCYLISKLFAEINNLGSCGIQTYLHTDNKSLYDAIGTSNFATDKRLRVDLASLREMNDTEKVNFRWVDSKSQLADVLTKKGANRKRLLDVLNSAHLDG